MIRMCTEPLSHFHRHFTLCSAETKVAHLSLMFLLPRALSICLILSPREHIHTRKRDQQQQAQQLILANIVLKEDN